MADKWFDLYENLVKSSDFLPSSLGSISNNVQTMKFNNEEVLRATEDAENYSEDKGFWDGNGGFHYYGE